MWRLRLQEVVVVGLRLILQRMPSLPIQRGLGFPTLQLVVHILLQLVMHILQLAMRILVEVLGLRLTLLPVQEFPSLILIPV